MLHWFLYTTTAGLSTFFGFYLWSKKGKLLISPLIQTVISCGLVFIGIVASLYGLELRQSFDGIIHGNIGAVDKTAVIFWGGFSIGLLLYFFSQNEVQTNEANRARALEDLINSAPPKDFLKVYSDNCKGSFKTLKAIEEAEKDKIDARHIELAVRSVLRLLISTVRYYWWETSPEIIYGANVMVACPPNKKMEIAFSSPDLDISKLECVLPTNKNFSISTSTPDKRDNDLPEIILPVFKKDRKRVVPGAPEAFHRGGSILVENTLSEKWLEEADKFDKDVKEKIRQYFRSGKGRKIKSFVSIALRDANNEVFAVLNIDSNKIAPWKGEDSALKLIYLINPFMDHLAVLLTLWNEMKKK